MGKMTDQQSGEAETPFTSLIDIVFLLLIFFMCATKFKQTEQRLDCFLPCDEGQMPTQAPLKKPEELSVFIKDDVNARQGNFDRRATRRATYFLMSRDAQPVTDPNQLLSKLSQLAANPEQQVLIALYDEMRDKDQLVPFFNVVALVDVCKMAGIQTVKFQAPAQTSTE
jgi:biopolymer transport protein ExbD